MAKAKFIIKILLVILIAVISYNFIKAKLYENRILKEVIQRLEADSRIAEVLVTNVKYDERDKKLKTTIKFLEYSAQGETLEPKYFTFSGNIIQFQSLVIRFDDMRVRAGDKLRGKSAYLFWKVFMLDGKNTQEYDITAPGAVPEGYEVTGDNNSNDFEKRLWSRFWRYALDNESAKKAGIKNAQIEAPGTMFMPGILYTVTIEHDGGMRIDTSPLPEILKGENIPGN